MPIFWNIIKTLNLYIILLCTHLFFNFGPFYLTEGHNRLDYLRFSTPDSTRSKACLAANDNSIPQPMGVPSGREASVGHYYYLSARLVCFSDSHYLKFSKNIILHILHNAPYTWSTFIAIEKSWVSKSRKIIKWVKNWQFFRVRGTICYDINIHYLHCNSHLLANH